MKAIVKSKLSRKKGSQARLADDASLLCVNCRESGHRLKNCSKALPTWSDEYDWSQSSRRKTLFDKDDFSASLGCCARCLELDLVGWLRQDMPSDFERDVHLGDVNDTLYSLDDSRLFRNLGSVGRMKLRNDCGLCRCFFGIIPTPTSAVQEVVLVKSWSLFRLEASIHVDTPDKRTSSRNVTAMLHPSPLDLNIADLASSRLEPLCITRDNNKESYTSLKALTVGSDYLDVQRIRTWLATCNALHPVTCASAWSQELQEIFLVDVEDKCVVSHPPYPCDYIALSYVWGGIDQRFAAAGQNGATLESLPSTIEDAIILVRQLGKRYLWVDAICIDQDNESEKSRQIGMLSLIYRGAYATIIALSGGSADAGLPGVENKSEYLQLTCTIGGTRIVSLGPNLSNLIWSQPWGTRAWTYQEALLSRRCIYISDFQTYFECNAMQCCESLDESDSWLHQTPRDETFLRSGNFYQRIGGGVLRNPFIEQQKLYRDALPQFSILLNLYCRRLLSDQRDALNAFSGILQSLEQSEYRDGFFWGLPVSDLNWALLWSGYGWPTELRPGFPKWCWASWQGPIWPGEPPTGHQSESHDPHKYPLDIIMWKRSEGETKKIFESKYAETNTELRFANDPIAGEVSSSLPSNEGLIQMSNFSYNEGLNLLCIEGVTLTFDPDLSRPAPGYADFENIEAFRTRVRGTSVRIYLPEDNPLIRTKDLGRQSTFLLLARYQASLSDLVHHYFLCLKKAGALYQRYGVMRLSCSKHSLHVLQELTMTRKQLVLL